MDRSPSEKKLTACAERLYLDLMYCRGDAGQYDMPYVAHLLNLACEELQKLVDADERSARLQADWNTFHIYPAMK
jgi:hypothetical protein